MGCTTQSSPDPCSDPYSFAGTPHRNYLRPKSRSPELPLARSLVIVMAIFAIPVRFGNALVSHTYPSQRRKTCVPDAKLSSEKQQHRETHHFLCFRSASMSTSRINLAKSRKVHLWHSGTEPIVPPDTAKPEKLHATLWTACPESPIPLN